MANTKTNAALTLVDLFAGCGGLSLGFEKAGFEPVAVAELNNSARATYLANRCGTHDFLRKELRIDAGEFAGAIDLNRHLVSVADVARLAGPHLDALKRSAARLPRKGIDVIAGGPPCQGFSGIGYRRTHRLEKREIPSNHLYRQMIRVIDEVQPRAFVFENVRGILSARWSASGEEKEVWRDIREAFGKKLGGKYRIAWSLVQARTYGVPQNRPRVLLIGVRRDLVPSSIGAKEEDAVAIGFLPQALSGTKAPDLIDVIGDLCDPLWYPHQQITRTQRYPHPATTEYQLEMRAERLGGAVRPKGSPVWEHEYSNHSPRVIERFQALLSNDRDTIERLRTRKFSQRVLPRHWGPRGPTMTVTSLPDDYVHYEQPRSFTVREWARLQGFPDWYAFEGPRTTGGERRAGNPSEGNWAREVPKYTQIGNAVPVKLAEVVARNLRRLIE
jgi:DNA (cytosine-5)-methyltransferase 1